MTPELRPLGIGEILDASIKLCLRNARQLAKVVLVVVLPVQAIAVIVTASTTPDDLPVGLEGLFRDPTQQRELDIQASEFAIFGAGQLAVGLLTILGALLATAACFKAISAAYLGQEPQWRESIRFALRLVPSLLWITLLAILLIIPAFIALIIPAIYLGVAWQLAVPALLAEDVRGRRALGRSFRLVRGRWWPTFGAIFLGALIAGIVASILQGLIVAVVAVGIEDQLANIVAGGIAGVVGGLITTPLQAAIVALVYFDLRVRKEGFDLELLAQRIGVERPADAGLAAGAPAAGTTPWDPPSPGPPPASTPPGPGAHAPGGPPPSAPPAPGSGKAQPPYWPPPPGWQPPSSGG